MELLFNKTRRDLLRFLVFGLAFSRCSEDEISPSLTLTYPIGKEILSAAFKIIIRWEAAKIEFIDLHYSFDKGKTWKTIASKIPASTSMFEWKTPVLNNEFVLIRIKDTNEQSNLLDISDDFEVWQNAQIKLSENTELNRVGGIELFYNTYFDDFAIIRLENDQFQVLSLSCTHLGCRVNWENNIFECPCHFSTFDKKGCVKNGPAQEPLSNFYYTFDSVQQIITVYRKAIKSDC